MRLRHSETSGTPPPTIKLIHYRRLGAKPHESSASGGYLGIQCLQRFQSLDATRNWDYRYPAQRIAIRPKAPGVPRDAVCFRRRKPDIVVGSPPEFKGEPDIWAPEELLVGSLNTCMMLTFLTLAQAQSLIPVGYESEAEGLLENVEEKYHITEVTVRPRVTLKSEAELEPARKIMESVEAHCFIANSIKARVTLTPEFIIAAPPT
jgi:organic hydroperoxide reductase OsmC/OhrA